MNFTKSLSKILLLFLSLSCSSKVKEIDKLITGKVIGVKDGDTIEILFEDKPLTIRFAHVDCPEMKKSQPFGQAAKKFTSDLCFGQTVTVITEGKFDRYKRLIAVIINEKNKNVNKELVKAGLAWHFKKYSIDTSYDELELTAKQNWAVGRPQSNTSMGLEEALTEEKFLHNTNSTIGSSHADYTQLQMQP